MATKLRDKLCFAWAGDFECLKRFVSEDLQLNGTWSQPGGDKKLFTFDDSVIIWRKNKNLLYLDGEKAGDVMKELCKQICKQDEDISAAKQSSNQVKVTIVYPSRNVAIPTLHDKQSPLA